LSKLVIVSNRLPVRARQQGRTLTFEPTVGGLATGLGSFYKSYESVWIGWPGIARDKLTAQDEILIKDQLLKERCYPVFLSQEDLDKYYHGFCNETIWPLFHYFLSYAKYSETSWNAYRRVNEIFSEVVVKAAEPGDTIWVQDYHLLLLPGLIRRQLPTAKIGLFLHIPFPSSEVFRLLPWREELLENLLGADLIGFHTYDYLRHFLATIHRILGYDQIFPGKLVVSVRDRVVKVDAFPMGIDYEHFAKAVKEQKTEQEIKKLSKQIGDRKVILSLDRLDYSKGLIRRLRAYSLFLDRFPQYKGRVMFVLKVIASRTKVRRYARLKKQLDELVGRINGKHGTIAWMPVWYLYQFLPETSLIALYHLADVALLTPLRDGMNLIAKEFLAARTDGKGVLILSEMAGAAKELREALIVNPNNRGEIAEAIRDALTMPLEEQQERNRIMQRRIQRYDVVRWAEDFVDSLSAVTRLQLKLASRKLSPSIRDRLITTYNSGENALLLLDYDGTLIPFARKPVLAYPDPELLSILARLSEAPGTEVVVISGRDKQTLEHWFGDLEIGLVAEHGVWTKKRGEPWQVIELLTNEWKRDIRPVLELYLDRTPGSFLEDKEFSLAWHYREADEEFAEVRVGELKADLAPLVANRNLGVLQGNRVIEVRNAGISKGRAALEWVSLRDWGFILAIGDDRTDEDIFSVLPTSAYSVNVGLQPSQSRFNLNSPQEVRILLQELATKGKEAKADR